MESDKLESLIKSLIDTALEQRSSRFQSTGKAYQLQHSLENNQNLMSRLKNIRCEDSSTDNKNNSSSLCTFCKQIMVDEEKKKKRNSSLGFFNYSFVYSKPEPAAVNKTKSTRNLKQSSGVLGSIDFDLSISKQRISGHSNVSEKRFPFDAKTMQSLAFKSIESNQENKENQSPKNFMKQHFKQKKTFLDPTQEENKHYRPLRTTFNQQGADPIELMDRDSVVIGGTPLSKVLERAELSDIEANSYLTSPSVTLQQNLLQIFENEKSLRKLNSKRQPSKSVQKQNITRQVPPKYMKPQSEAKPKFIKSSTQKNISNQETLYQKILNQKHFK